MNFFGQVGFEPILLQHGQGAVKMKDKVMTASLEKILALYYISTAGI